MKPNLFIIGAPKTGSTSLYHYLADHPQVYMCPDKEPHIFSTELHTQCLQHHGKLIKFTCTSAQDYETLFADTDNYKIAADASTSYLYSTVAAENIHHYNPDAKIIAILRNPTDLLNSWYHYINYTSEETAASFEQALALEAERKQDSSKIPASVWYPQRIFYRELVQFDQQLQRYYKLFDRDKIKVILTEDMHADAQRSYNEVLSFLQLDPHNPDFSRHNVYQNIRFKKLKRLIDNCFSPIKNSIRDNPNSTTNKFITSMYKKAMSENQKSPVVNNELKQILEQEFIPMVGRTAELTGIDLLEKWHYRSST
jgi:hypothetical protein